MAYEPRYEISTKQEIILGPQFLNLALKALVKNHQTNIFETKIIVMGGTHILLDVKFDISLCNMVGL